MAEAFHPPYPGYDVLAKWDSPSWNDQTRRVIARRLTEIPPRRFFTPPEWDLLERICERLIPQPERTHPIPIVPWIDHRLDRDSGDGYRYADLPPQRDAWRQGLAAIADEARRKRGKPFEKCDAAGKDALLADIQHGNVVSDGWHGLPPEKFFSSMLLTRVVETYYSHPAAWSEIGFGGPASPRGYVRMDANRADPWEAQR